MTTEKIRPTKKQKELLDFINAFIKQNGYSPSYREIMSSLKYNSVATVALHINNLITRGHLKKGDHSARSIEVVELPEIETPLKTNQIKESDEKWLVEKVNSLFSELEKLPHPMARQLDELYVLIGALRVLGLEGAVQSFIPRLTELKKKLGK